MINDLNSNTLDVVDLQVNSIDQLIELYKQGYKLVEGPYKTLDGNTVIKMQSLQGGIVVVGLVGILWFIFWAVIIYIIGKAIVG